MRKQQKSILDKLDLDSIKTEVKPIINTKEILKHPVTKIIIAGVAVYGFLYISKHFVNAYGELVKAVRSTRKSLSE